MGNMDLDEEIVPLHSQWYFCFWYSC